MVLFTATSCWRLTPSALMWDQVRLNLNHARSIKMHKQHGILVGNLLALNLLSAFAMAQTDPKVLILGAGENLWQAELSAERGPIYADEEQLAVNVDFPELARLIAHRAALTVRQNENGFYREKRGFNVPQATFSIIHVDGTKTV